MFLTAIKNGLIIKEQTLTSLLSALSVPVLHKAAPRLPSALWDGAREQ